MFTLVRLLFGSLVTALRSRAALAAEILRTLKESLGLGSLKPLTLQDLERRLNTGLLHYA